VGGWDDGVCLGGAGTGRVSDFLSPLLVLPFESFGLGRAGEMGVT